jgi:Holliday junction resolvase
MSGISWEREVANYLERQGYSTKLRETIQDHEIDVYAEKDGRILVVECKDWNSNVSPDSVRQCNSVANDIGAEPVIAYTSELASGAQQLVERWDFVELSADIVRGEVTTLDEVREAVQTHELYLPNEYNLTDLDDPIGPFVPDEAFAENVSEAAEELTLGSLSRSKNWIERRVQDECSQNSEYPRCIPVVSHEKIHLYFVDTDTHDILPADVRELEVELS